MQVCMYVCMYDLGAEHLIQVAVGKFEPQVQRVDSL